MQKGVGRSEKGSLHKNQRLFLVQCLQFSQFCFICYVLLVEGTPFYRREDVNEPLHLSYEGVSVGIDQLL